MSMEKLAELLHVDEVEVHHGRLGFALYVRLGEETVSTTVDHDAIQKSGTKYKMNAVAHRLENLADTLHTKGMNAATRAAMAAEAELTSRRVTQQPIYEQRGRQLQRTAPEPSYTPPAPPAGEASVSKSMPSRFHAIVAELDKL